MLLLKDRHNGNILIDSLGRMVHIDLGFMLGHAPGGITFEKPQARTHSIPQRPHAFRNARISTISAIYLGDISAQFKLTREMVDVWGGKGSPLWTEFIELMTAGMSAMQKHHVEIVRDRPCRAPHPNPVLALCVRVRRHLISFELQLPPTRCATWRSLPHRARASLVSCLRRGRRSSRP